MLFLSSKFFLDAYRCVVVSFDDGTLRILSLVKAAYDVPVTGKPFVGTQQQGFHSYYCSSFAIWSVQVSRQTGSFALFMILLLSLILLQFTAPLKIILFIFKAILLFFFFISSSDFSLFYFLSFWHLVQS